MFKRQNLTRFESLQQSTNFGAKNTAKWKILFFKVSPQITVSPRNQSIPEGKTAKLICKATGFPKPAMTWTFNDGSLPSLAIEKYTKEGYQLLLQNVTKYMEGI